MDIHELRKKPHLSVSAINDYIDCGLLYKFSRIDKLDRDYNLDAFAYGKADVTNSFRVIIQSPLEGVVFPSDVFC